MDPIDGRRRPAGWRPGDLVVYRELWHGDPISALPLVVVEDRDGRTVLYRPARIAWTASRIRGREREWSHQVLLDTLAAAPSERTLVPLVSSDQHTLIIHPWSTAASIRLAWDPGWTFLEWYVNLERPWRYTSLGVDSMDHLLDIVVQPDFRWRLKDEDELAEALRRDLFTPSEVDAVVAEAARIAGAIDRREPPFDEPWPSWRPDPDWPVPVLPAGWDRVPTATAPSDGRPGR